MTDTDPGHVTPWPVIANVGGPIDPDDHIGHQLELDAMLASTESVGALLTGDRRMGKTSLLRKAEHCLSEHVVLRISAETDDADLFGRRFLEVLRGNHAFADELKRWHIEVDVGYRGIRLTRRPGEGSGTEDVDDLFVWAAQRVAPAKLIVVIDEITVLVAAIERQRPGGGVEFLRNLRRPRQELPNVVNILSARSGCTMWSGIPHRSTTSARFASAHSPMTTPSSWPAAFSSARTSTLPTSSQ